jgi:hypothetical protein
MSFHANNGARNGYIQFQLGAIDIVHGASADIKFVSNSTERMRIDSAGNVGIGTSAPASPLHVVGGARVDSTGIRSLSVVGGTPSYTKTLTITGLTNGVAIVYVGLIASGSATSLAAAYLHGGVATATTDQKTLSVLNATASGSCSIAAPVKVSGGFSVAITVSAGTTTQLNVHAIGDGAQSLSATFS